MANVGSKQSMPFLVGSLAGGNIVTVVLNMLSGIMVARLLAPATLGIFNGIGLVLRYALFLQLGITTGLYRELPYYIGKGNHERAHSLAATAQGWALVVAAIVSVALFGIAGWNLIRGEYWLAAAWTTQAILAIFLFYKTAYLLATYRTAHDFSKVALVTVIESVASLVVLLMVALLGFYGLCFRAVLTGIVGGLLLHYWRPIRVRPTLNFQDLKHLLFVGAPIMASGQIFQMWMVINTTLVFSLLGAEGMGLYSIVAMSNGALSILPLAVNQVLFPRMTEKFGLTGNVQETLKVAFKPILLTTAGLIPVIALAQWLVEPAVLLVVPKYIDAVPAARWSLFLPLLTNLRAINSVFTIVKQQRLFVTATIIGAATYFAALKILTNYEVTLVAFPQAMLIGQLVFVIICYTFAIYLSKKNI